MYLVWPIQVFFSNNVPVFWGSRHNLWAEKNKIEYSRIEKKVFIVTELCKRRLRELCKAQFMYFICLFLTRKQQRVVKHYVCINRT